MKFTIVMTMFGSSVDLFMRSLQCVLNQTHRNWELLIIRDGPGTTRVEELLQNFRDRDIKFISLPAAEGCWGNVSRRHGVEIATGDYVCWLGHDNTIYPNYLSDHATNIHYNPRCISLVHIEYWNDLHNYVGVFPNKNIGYAEVDLLNFAMPIDIAKEVAFLPKDDKKRDADYWTFDAARQLLPLERSRTIAGVHY
jgi:glycosyltransferase involved in cell wall biosynthesis